MGRQSAGRGFMRGLAKSYEDDQQTLRLIHAGGKRIAELEKEVRETGWKKAISHHAINTPQEWVDGLMYYPAPINTQIAWQRSRQGIESMALCGVTHTISSSGVLAQIAEYIHGPFCAWDALICTSQSVLKTVHQVWEFQKSQLAFRLGVDKINPTLPMTPVIPLGIHVDDFIPDQDFRVVSRQEMQIQDDEIVVLYVGRLSLHAKANPLPMYLACARAANQTKRKIRIIECGWFSNEDIKKCFEEASEFAGISVTRIDGRVPHLVRQAFAVADIFMSLSDNIQETFGLTPLEAMAAGIAVIASDWDGYRETIRHGVDGILIPTTQPGLLDCAQAMSEGYEDGKMNYDHYIGHSHLMTSVDISACSQALKELIESPEKRAAMGASGMKRAREIYDWKVVMKDYRALWSEQELKRKHAANTGKTILRNPAFLNPLQLFDHYPSQLLEPGTLLWRDTITTDPEINSLRTLKMWGFAANRLDTPEQMLQACLKLPHQNQPGLTIQEWAATCGWTLNQGLRHAAWLHKVGAIHIENLAGGLI